jgi:ubiquinone/menaquinone biosynthesis C-methylase UbiE
VNPIHNVICSSKRWRRRAEGTLVPWALRDARLGDEVLEVGPGFGATTRALARRLRRLDVLELDERYCERLRVQLGNRVNVTRGDATAMPYPEGRFSAVLCFTMLHHIPSRELQDKAFAEVARVLAPGGVFLGTDSIGSGVVFKLIHIGDTMVLIDPDELPARLQTAGLTRPVVERDGRSFRWDAQKPG